MREQGGLSPQYATQSRNQGAPPVSPSSPTPPTNKRRGGWKKGWTSFSFVSPEENIDWYKNLNNTPLPPRTPPVPRTRSQWGVRNRGDRRGGSSEGIGEVNRLLLKIRDEGVENDRVSKEEERTPQALLEVKIKREPSDQEGPLTYHKRCVEGKLMNLPKLPPNTAAKRSP